MDAKIRENEPRTFSVNLARRKFPKCVRTSRLTASFLEAKIEKMRPELYYQDGKAKTSKMRLNSTANRFVFGHINREIVPSTFTVILASGEHPECI